MLFSICLTTLLLSVTANFTDDNCTPGDQGIYTVGKLKLKLASAGFPLYQVDNKRCTWTYKAKESQCVRLQVTKCDLQGSRLQVSEMDKDQATLVTRNFLSCSKYLAEMLFETKQHGNYMTIFYDCHASNSSMYVNGTGFTGVVSAVDCGDPTKAGFQFPMWGFYVIGGVGAMVLGMITIFIIYKCCCGKKKTNQVADADLAVAIPIAQLEAAKEVAIPSTSFNGPAQAMTTMPQEGQTHHSHTSHYHAQSQPTIIHYNGIGAPNPPTWKQN